MPVLVITLLSCWTENSGRDIWTVIWNLEEINVLLESIMCRWSCELVRDWRCIWVPRVGQRPSHLGRRELWDLGPAGSSCMGPEEHRCVWRWSQQGKRTDWHTRTCTSVFVRTLIHIMHYQAPYPNLNLTPHSMSKILQHPHFSSLYWNFSSSNPVNNFKWYKGKWLIAWGKKKKKSLTHQTWKIMYILENI